MPVENKISEEVKLLKDTLSRKFNTKQIILFGSFAYGQPDADSDIDVCVIADEVKPVGTDGACVSSLQGEKFAFIICPWLISLLTTAVGKFRPPSDPGPSKPPGHI